MSHRTEARQREDARRLPLAYALHSGNLYGTERIALATVAGLSDVFEPTLIAPTGRLEAEARRRGLEIRIYRGRLGLLRELLRFAWSNSSFGFVGTTVVQSLFMVFLSALLRRRATHVHVVHGGTSEKDSYGRKHLLGSTPVRLVAVSAFVRDRLIAHGVKPDRVRVVPNFLTPNGAGARNPSRTGGLRRVVVVSRADTVKRVDLLLEALAARPALSTVRFRILGDGPELGALRERAKRDHTNVEFAGFVRDVGAELSSADLLLHLCPTEPFGLVVLEAWASGLPVLVPDAAGPREIVADGSTGFLYRAGDSRHLAEKLTELDGVRDGRLGRVARQARRELRHRFAPETCLSAYRTLLLGGSR